jgi:transposase InsO family protein
LTKWVEVKEMKDATEKRVVEFLQESIFSRFGYPREIVTDQGSQFTSRLIKKIMQQHHICQRKSTSYHPQENGQAEVTNKELENILTKTIIMNKKNWSKKLIEAVWAYNITWKGLHPLS